jgi:hypothetical protein
VYIYTYTYIHTYICAIRVTSRRFKRIRTEKAGEEEKGGDEEEKERE